MAMTITSFGKKIRESRHEARISLRAMTSALGVSSSFLCGIEFGREKIPPDLIGGIVRIFGEKGYPIDEQELHALAVQDFLKTAYRNGTGLEPDREPSNQALIDAVAELLPPDVIPQIEAFLTDKPYLFDRIRKRSGQHSLFRQPAVLLIYFLVDRMPAQTRERWPLDPEELVPLFSDLGVSLMRG